MADKRSRKLMALRAAVLLAISYTLGGVVQNEWQLLAMRCFQGFASGLWPACLAILACSVPRDKVGFSLGIMQGAMTAGGVLGPFCGGALAEMFSMRMTFFIGGGALFVITLLIAFFIHEPPRKAQEPSTVKREKTNLPNCGVKLRPSGRRYNLRRSRRRERQSRFPSFSACSFALAWCNSRFFCSSQSCQCISVNCKAAWIVLSF